MGYSFNSSYFNTRCMAKIIHISERVNMKIYYPQKKENYIFKLMGCLDFQKGSFQ